MSRSARTSLLALCATIAGAAPAAAGPFDDYRDDGQVDACSYSDGELRSTLDSLPPDVLQYSPGLADQLAAGREGCGGGAPGSVSDTRDFEAAPAIGAASGRGRGGGPGGAGAGAAAAEIPPPPAPGSTGRARLAQVTTPPVSATTRSDVPGWLTALLVVGGAAGILLALARGAGASAERFTRPLRASFVDAGGRSADAAAQLLDSVRLGR